MSFKNPNYVNQAELDSIKRYETYKPFIVEFFAQLPVDQEVVKFDEVREFFAKHSNQALVDKVPDMDDGLLHDLCQRHGIELAQ